MITNTQGGAFLYLEGELAGFGYELLLAIIKGQVLRQQVERDHCRLAGRYQSRLGVSLQQLHEVKNGTSDELLHTRARGGKTHLD